MRNGFKLPLLILVFLALQLIVLSRAHAEYRVYRLGVTYQPGQVETEVVTTLDNIQYETYNKITPEQKTRIIEHWMCWGPTNDFAPYCPKPLSQAQSQAKN